MKIRETLSEQDYTKIFDRDVVGIFKYLFDSDDKFYSMNVDACLYYYLQRSANKTISPFYEELLKREADANLLISKVIRARFLEKWNKIYDALMLSEYNAIEDYVHKKDKTETEENGNVYRSETTGDGNTGSETETTSTSEGYDDVYGFNSEESVHSGKNGSTDNELVTADSSKNTSHNEELVETSNSEDKELTGHEELSGRNTSAPKLIDEEIRMRNVNIFLDTVCSDVDKVATINIYL